MSEKRFYRTELLLGRERFERISSASVIVVGIGAVGYTAAEVLIRMGINDLTLVDCDIIEKSDFNRHLLGVEENLNISKVEAAVKRLMSINPEAKISGEDTFFHRDTAEKIFSKNYDFLIDAIDSLNPKVELIKFCLARGQPFISTMGAARRMDPTLVRISTINQAKKCPLLRHVKKRLRREGIYDDFYVVYSEEEVCGEIKKADSMYHQRGRVRDILPSSMIVTATFGIYAAHAAIQYLLNKRCIKSSSPLKPGCS